MRLFTLVLSILFLCSGCISLSLSTDKPIPAEGIRFTNPPLPFKRIKHELDATWISEVTGNSISYISSCKGSVEVPLNQLEVSALASLDSSEIIHSQDIHFQGRAAKKTRAAGLLDGIPMRLSILVFKKNNCDYTLIYGGIEKNFAQEENHFEEFINSFRVP